MNFAEKKQAYDLLQSQEHLEADKELLLKKSPKSPALKVGMINREQAQREIIWALLEVASVEEITDNRPAPVKELTKEETDMILVEAAKLTNLIHSVKTLEEKEELINQIIELIKPLPDEATEIMLKLPLSIVPDFVKTAEFVEKLLTVDFLTVKQPELANIARGLKIEAPDYKLATLRPILEEYRLNLPKEGAATGEEMIPVAAHLETVNVLIEEKDALVDELEEKELENEDLQEQLEEKEAKLSDAVAELVEAKKKADTDPV